MTYLSNFRLYKPLIQVLLLTGLFLTGKTTNSGQTALTHHPYIFFIEDSWTEALKQAKLKNKYIFADAYATWCGPCKMLQTTTFANAKAAAFFNSNFVNVAIDMEKGEGPGLAAQWGIRAYPTLIIFNPNGKPVLGTVGFLNADDLIRFGKQALNK
ncbi:MAG TPA: thioredoxin domain-containing protein [Mucilaginibacter sp.]|jgi:thiol:disulfide interchange protein